MLSFTQWFGQVGALGAFALGLVEQAGLPLPAYPVLIIAGARKFLGEYAHRRIKGGVGHNLPQETPQAFA